MRFLWDIRTPFGTPVDPLVYMMIAMSSVSGGLGGAGCSLPKLTTDWKEMISTPSLNPSVLVLKSGSSMNMTCFTFGQFSKMFLNFGRKALEVITKDTSVSLMPWQIASSPRFV